MKRIFIIFLTILMAIALNAAPAFAAKTAYIKTARTGGGANALDGIDGNNLNDGDIAYVIQSGLVYFYENDADGSLTEDDPSVIVPNANPGTNCWLLKMAAFPLATTATAQILTGRVYSINLTSSETITGASKFGGWISGASESARAPESGVTATMESSTGQGENVVYYTSDDTSVSGNSVFVVFPAGDTVVCESDIISGASAIKISGATMAQVVTIIGTGVSKWTVIAKTTPTLRNQ